MWYTIYRCQMLDIQEPRPGEERTRERDTRTRIVRNYLKNSIVDHHLFSGDPLPSETKIAQELAISRGSVREAVKALESLGIVEVRHGEGLFVRDTNLDPLVEVFTFGSHFDPSLLAELLELRTWLETAVIGDVVKKISELQLKEIVLSLSEWEKDLKQGILQSKDDQRFHRSLYKILGNQTLLRLLAVFWTVFENIGIEDIRRDPTPMETWEEHRAIYETVLKHDGKGARKAILKSNSHVMERIRKVRSQRDVDLKEGGGNDID